MSASTKLDKTHKFLTDRIGITFRQGKAYSHPILNCTSTPPAGEAIVTEAIRKGQVIGKTVVIPIKVESWGESFIAGLNMESEVSSKYRGFGVYPILINECMKICAENEIKYIYGFPNKNAIDNIIKYCGFKLIGTVPFLAKPMVPIAPMQRVLRSHLAAKALMSILRPALSAYRLYTTMGATAATVSELSDGLTFSKDIWESTRQERPLHVIRDKDFMDWRYSADEYIKLECSDPATNSKGLAVISIREKDNYRLGFLCELMVDNYNKGVANRLIREAEKKFVEAGADFACSLAMHGTHMYKTLKETGYMQPPSRFFNREFWYIGKNIGDSNDDRFEIFNNWLLTLSDFDVA